MLFRYQYLHEFLKNPEMGLNSPVELLFEAFRSKEKKYLESLLGAEGLTRSVNRTAGTDLKYEYVPITDITQLTSVITQVNSGDLHVCLDFYFKMVNRMALKCAKKNIIQY